MVSKGVLFVLMTIAVYNSIHAQTLVGHWTFEKGVETKDLTGNFGDVVLRGSGAVIQDGMLDVGPNNFAVAGSYTGPTISTKTLVSWVSIDSFDTQKGSVLTIDKVNSDEFDAIVFGELQDKRWLAGSMNFARTVSNPTPGFEETELNIPIQMAITYENTNGGTHVIMYRNGNKIADFTKGAFASWQAGDAEIFWGLRHGNANSAGPGRLDCKIEESRIYDSVLTAEQLKGLKLDKPNSIDLIGQFTFESGEETIDITGHFGDIVLQGATIENGLLEVGTGRGAITGSYKGPEIHEKTLVSWVSIESLPVQKSSVPSILVDNIDAVVPGSVFEKVKLNVMVQLAISYENTSCNAHIKLYENGVKFRDYIKGSFFDVMSGNAEIFWGDRQTSEDCGLGMCHTADARIEESRIYAGVLTEDDLKQLVPRKLADTVIDAVANSNEVEHAASLQGMDDSSKRQETSNDEVVTNEFMLHGTDIPKFQETSNEVIAANDFEDAMYMLQGTDSPEFQETQKLRQQQEVQAEAAAAYMDIDKIRWQIYGPHDEEYK